MSARSSVAPDGVPHFSEDPDQPFYFYTGWPSNFDRKHALYLPPPAAPPQPAFARVPLRYDSGEHWLHCNKARTWEAHERIRRAGTPYEAKERGSARQLPMDVDEVRAWDARRYEVMMIGLRAKAAQNRGVLRALLATGERLIAEDSPTDDIWGIRDRAGAMTGSNLLGKAWMQVRAELSS
jgi:ribA/ribD-fused uncharacterized protein